MKIPKILKVTIVVSILAVVFLGLSIGSAFYSVNRSKSSIDAIGNITVDSDLTLKSAKERLDKAITDYEKLDRNLKLDKKIDNIDVLYEKEREFVNVAILLANSVDQQKVKLNLTNQDVAKYILDIDQYKNSYITDDEFQSLASYETYETLKEQYKDFLAEEANNSEQQSGQTDEEEIELC